MEQFDSDFIPASCVGEKCYCGKQARHKVEEILFEDDPTVFVSVGIMGKVMARHPSTSYVCSKCFGKIMGRTTIPGFKV